MRDQLLANVYILTAPEMAGAAAVFALVAYGIGYCLGAICTPRHPGKGHGVVPVTFAARLLARWYQRAHERNYRWAAAGRRVRGDR